MQPANSHTAPGELELVREFVNTNDIEDQQDELSSPQALLTWMAGHELLEAHEPVTEEDLRRAVEVREALRGLMLANNGESPDDSDIAILNRLGEDACLTVRFAPDGHAHLRPGVGGVDGALGHFLAIVYTSMADGSWTRLKACRNDACEWAFYDHSKNRSGTWCTMRICGSRHKARAYRERQKSRG